jgi:hypothetical protein
MDLCQPDEHGGQTLLGENGAGAVLALVHCGVGLALGTQQRPQVGRPAQHGKEAEVDGVVETIAIRRARTIGERVTERSADRMTRRLAGVASARRNLARVCGRCCCGDHVPPRTGRRAAGTRR